MGLNRMMMKNGNPKDVFIAYIDRTIRQFEDNALTTVGSRAFSGCSSLASIDLPNVTTVENYAFSGCSSLASIDLPNVTIVRINAFLSCKSLKEIHFATKNKEAIEALSGYSNKFGATNATIYFDI